MLAHFLENSLENHRAGQVSRILGDALDAADPRRAVTRALRLDGERLEMNGGSVDLRGKRVRVVGAGKAAVAMTRGLLDVLGDRVEGVIIAKHAPDDDPLPDSIRVLTGAHPVPGEESVTATCALAESLSGCTQEDLVIALISGGGSALMTLPQDGIDLPELQLLTRSLLACGASINEMNTLRKHLDSVKGGGLAKLASPARLITLILSDVTGSPLDVIASGPTVPDSTTYQDALAILKKYDLERRVPRSIARLLEKGVHGEIPDTAKPGDPIFERVTNRIIADNSQAAEAALAQAKAEGFNTLLLTTYLQGEASQAGVFLAGVLREVAVSGRPLPRPCCIVAGGETTVTLHGQGKGGRNQELAVGAMSHLAGLPDIALITLATDGEDGPTDAAGAVITGETLEKAREMALSPLLALQSNNTYPFLDHLGALLKPGPTGTNVNDLAFLFAF